ncbi:MAG: twin-arginine translocase TatA/TatE family subunit [Thermodesulfobacteriaceae bacterium]|nr:twin-arginine translocase TatA/TatE family subunit [Thermodesulfobacteriaceae bacterium]MCX8041927.1 twin-arginine translocase TatA/TatE family subunit [Thermodesulfobacteriaceae bacterium]MDW8136361.1 twin-arginine translocase TatA/TatE family subunit [Thermodesulfobacterium sp.]
MFNIEFSEVLIILLVALIVLGPEKLPEIGKFWAKISLEAKKSIEEIKKELKIKEIEKEVEEIKEILKKEIDGKDRAS